MRASTIAAVMVLCVSAGPARAQEPYNVTVNVTELSRIFTELYGPGGLVVNSLAALSGGVSHSAHFNSAFESEFSQFGSALTGQIVTHGAALHWLQRSTAKLRSTEGNSPRSVSSHNNSLTRIWW